MDRRTAAAPDLTVADIDARDVAPATITVAEIQGGRDARLPLTQAFIAIRLHTLLRECVAGSVALEPRSAAEFAIYTHRLFQILCFNAFGARQEIASATRLQYLARTLHSCQRPPHIRRMYLAHASAFGALDHARTASLGKLAVQAEKRIAPAGTDGFEFAKPECSLHLQNYAHVRPAQSLRALLKRPNLGVRQSLLGALVSTPIEF